jgi:hypothetical protein
MPDSSHLIDWRRHMPHHGPHNPGPHGPHHGHGWIEFDRKDTTREEFGEEVSSLGRLIADSSELTFGDVLIAMPELITVETVFERNPHGNFVLRIHAEWPEYEAPRRSRMGRSPKFGTPERPGGEA